ncbi:MAG TPA: helix-turn-helix domain-containing protein [Gemmatimonas sp.]|uniref:TetR/AcrR family transcriptional regulator n=1 Tax=Gemmatimonas sp. TaxID=1962908 RepID=UPI002ED91D6D
MISRDAGREPEKEGLRERKQRETRIRIAEKGLKLFLKHGYDAVTLDDIAEAAGISRRTFFSYFKSKEDVVLVWQTASWTTMLAELRAVSPDTPPLEAVRAMLVRNAAPYESAQMRTIDNLMRSNDTLIARKSALYVVHEQLLYEMLCEVWRQPELRPTLRLVAMISVGVMRLSIETWRAEEGVRSAAEVLNETFARARSEMSLML